MRFSATIAAMALASALPLAAVAPASADTVEIGTLDCQVAGGAGFVFGSTKDLVCDYKPLEGPVETYAGTISKFGVDIGVTGTTLMKWTVLAPTSADPLEPGALAGEYVGASAEASAAAGAGASVLVGGFDKSINLQPVAIQVQEGVNVAAGIARLEIEPVAR
ncbi:hypothetical protein CSC94_14230 [Zhengella mangrovi]|uniref:DUF992 domain-containing protein n=1 Tax=Zhengella mangrovi TaxID=1982044 RepID=A0A2G1QLU3_9HYPH|nr:DUF992 domain-containing protein [Zhengella mangrovi]PHP66439.1 hypothetical protein CSC94_14230 [Zhengella mangrovi]